MKACPVCFEQVHDDADECGWCGERIAPAPVASGDPRSARTYPVVGRSRMKRGALMAAAAIVVIAAVLLTRGGDAPESPGGTATDGAGAASERDTLRSALTWFNEANYQNGTRNMVDNLNSGGARCWVGYQTGDLLLVTIIWPSGYWVQFNPARTEDEYLAMVGSVRQGDDYTAAGISPSEFDANGLSCEVGPEGVIDL